MSEKITSGENKRMRFFSSFGRANSVLSRFGLHSGWTTTRCRECGPRCLLINHGREHSFALLTDCKLQLKIPFIVRYGHLNPYGPYRLVGSGATRATARQRHVGYNSEHCPNDRRSAETCVLGDEISGKLDLAAHLGNNRMSATHQASPMCP